MTDLGKGRIQSFLVCVVVVACLWGAAITAQNQTPAMPTDVSEAVAAQDVPGQTVFLPERLKRIDAAVESAIKEGALPGAVVLVGRSDRTEYFKAFGNRSVQPKTEPMTKDTVFDVSSLTKVVATTPSIMLLVEEGSLRLGDRVSQYLPRFKGGGKSDITVRQLLTHYSGLPADFDLSKKWFGYKASLEELWSLPADSKPDEKFVYSDINFIALGEIVHVLSGKTLDVFSKERIFEPLGMEATCFCPPGDMVGRIAPTEMRRNTLQYLHGDGTDVPADTMLRGDVHDPTAWRMGGVAGHAGLFSSAEDVAIYARMLLNLGKSNGVRFLSPLTVRAMTSPQSPPGATEIRGYGWDIQSDYSSPRGDIFMGGYGHTGFTGTSIWVHPPTDTFIIILSNKVHPKGGKNVNHLRAVVANIVASAISDAGGVR
jgi:CubicO group peptidase (beta-lactamase class C family)